MIQVKKPRKAPEVLRTKGKKKRRAHCKSYTRDKEKYDSGEKTFKFDSGIYGHKTVKGDLIQAQHYKCCFCESTVTHIAYGDVEHFRPKAGFAQEASEPLQRPGYYWLAYEWSNLFFCCQLCNQHHKRNLFPLKNPTMRARSHYDCVESEEPLFISPEEDPEKYISFREEVAYPIKNNQRGKATINALALNRDKLADNRKEHYETLELIHFLANHNPPLAQTSAAKRLLERAKKDTSKYSAMVRSALKVDFK